MIILHYTACLVEDCFDFVNKDRFGVMFVTFEEENKIKRIIDYFLSSGLETEFFHNVHHTVENTDQFVINRSIMGYKGMMSR